MVKNRIFLYLTCFVWLTTTLSCNIGYEEFQPTLFENDNYKRIEGDTSFYKNLEKVLRFYNVKYKIDNNGKILVRLDLVMDKDLMFNYTIKALDPRWLNSHQP